MSSLITNLHDKYMIRMVMIVDIFRFRTMRLQLKFVRFLFLIMTVMKYCHIFFYILTGITEFHDYFYYYLLLFFFTLYAMNC